MNARFAILSSLMLMALLLAIPVFAQIPGLPEKAELMLWVKAEDLAHLDDGARVGAWLDASGRNHHLFAPAAAFRPTYAVAGLTDRPAVVFSNDLKVEPPVIERLIVPEIRGEWPSFTLLVVGHNLSRGEWFGTAYDKYSNVRLRQDFQHLGTKIGIPGLAAMGHDAGIQLVTLAAGLEGLTEAGFTRQRYSAYGNGKLLNTETFLNTKHGVLFSDMRFGAYLDPSRWQGAFAEILLYRGMLGDDERTAAERYLMAKYGMLPEGADAPAIPVGYAPPPPPPSLPEVHVQPVTAGLRLWARADDIRGVDRLPISAWPLATGDGQIIGKDYQAPTLVRGAINGRAVARFAGVNDEKAARTIHALTLPLEGEWPEITVAIAGSQLLTRGLIDTAPGERTALRRQADFLQHGGGARSLFIRAPFSSLQPTQPMMCILTVGKSGETGQYLTLQTHGVELRRVEVNPRAIPVLLKNAMLGVSNVDEQAFSGDIAEILIYDRALSAEERRQTEEYLAEKYALPLKATAQLAADPPVRSPWSYRLPHLPSTLSWIGNTESGKHGRHIQGDMFDIHVFPDGTVAAISVWDEMHKEIGFYTDGQSVIDKGIAGGGGNIYCDGTYIYAGVSGMKKANAGVRRLTLDLKDAPWPGLEPKGQIFFDTPAVWDEISGIAVINGELFISCRNIAEVRVYDAASGQYKRALPIIPAPKRLLADHGGKLWISNAEGVAQYNVDGTPTGQRIAGISAGALAMDAQGRLLVAEDGARQQIIWYDVTGNAPREVETLGELGGVLRAPRPGEVGDYRLLQPKGLGVDAEGNVYVLDLYRIRSYDTAGRLRWKVECTHFCIASAFDPASDGVDAYTVRHHFQYTPGQPPGKDWVWKGYTEDTRRFPELSGMRGQAAYLYRFNGTLYRFIPYAGAVIIQRQEEASEIFIPCGLVKLTETQTMLHAQMPPNNERHIWRDVNGNGLVEADEIMLPTLLGQKSEWGPSYFIDARGGIWYPQGRIGVRYLPMRGFTPQGAPIYDFADEVLIPRPAEFINVRRAHYYADEDVMILTGYTWDEQEWEGEQWVGAGRIAVVYEDWSQPTRAVRSRIPFIAPSISSMTYLAQRNMLFAVEVETAVVFCYDTSTGRLLGIVEADADLIGNIGWVDLPGGAMHAIERQNGEIVITVEDSYTHKELVYRLPAGFEAQFRE